MSVLVLQFIIKKWEKDQQSIHEQKARSMQPDRYLLTFPPAQYLFDNNLVLDQRGDDIESNRISYGITKLGHLSIDRFLINLNEKTLKYQEKSDSTVRLKLIGSIDDSWVQCKYNWRYSVYKNDFYYWQYEEVTLNVIYLNTFNEATFLESEPAITCTDLI